MSKRAIILAGGIGSRLRPYTIVLPKPLMPVGEYSIIEIIIRQLSYYGFDYITVTISKKAEIIPAFLGDGSKWNIKIDYSVEEIPLSTMGPLKLIRNLPENFLVMNGDVLTDLNFDEFYKFHIRNQELFTISAQERTEKSEYGVLDLREDDHLSGFREKPISTYTVSMGIYMAKKEILDYIPENKAFGFDHLMLKFLEENKSVMVRKHDGYWLDIGRSADYNRAVDEFNDYKKSLLPGL